jgi:hypothetical protein
VLCLNPSNTEPTDIKDLHYEWSSGKKHQTPPRLFDSRRDQPTTQRQSDMSKSRYTSLFCQKHEEPLAFYHSQYKQLMCATCLYNSNFKGQQSIYSSIRGSPGVLPLRNALEQMKTELKKDYGEMTNISAKVESTLRSCRHSKGIIEGNIQSILEEVTTVCQTMIQAIKKREATLKQAINEFFD